MRRVRARRAAAGGGGLEGSRPANTGNGLWDVSLGVPFDGLGKVRRLMASLALFFVDFVAMLRGTRSRAIFFGPRQMVAVDL